MKQTTVVPSVRTELPSPGDRLDKYRIDRVLGQGGMGVVYAATHANLGPVAIKMLFPQLSADPTLAARFLNEAKAAARLQDPGIVKVYDYGQTAGGASYLVMEYLSGETLGARLAWNRGPRPAALPLCWQVASVLAVVHEQGIVHRDLKPDNVMVVRDAAMPGGERVKLLDFGIAKLSAEQAVGAILRRGPTRTGATMGTPLYMAPEQYQDAGRATDRADVYALGVILFQVLTGELPITADSFPALVLLYARRQAPRQVRDLYPAVPPALAALVARMLGYDPPKRPSMAEVRDQLLPLLQSLESPRGANSGRSRPVWRRPAGLALVGVACLLGLGSLGAYVFRRPVLVQPESALQSPDTSSRAASSERQEPALVPSAADLATPPGLGSARGGDGTGQSKSIGTLVASGPSEGIGTGEKTEKKGHAIVQESAPQDLDPVDLDPAAVAAKIRQYRGALVACYEAALNRNASLAGKITLRFSISKLGKVSNVEIEVDTMHDDHYSKCIIDRASSWRFPPPQSGSSEVQFAYPFIFQSSK